MVGDDFDKAAISTAQREENSRALETLLGGQPREIDTQAALTLINAGIEPDMRFKHDNTLLLMATYVASPTVVTALLENGANPNLGNRWGETPLHYAAKGLSLKSVEALLKHGAEIYAKTKEGETVESCAEKGNTDAYGAGKISDVVAFVRDALQQRIKSDWDKALLRDEVQTFTTGGCATSTEVKPMKRLQIKTPGTE